MPVGDSESTDFWTEFLRSLRQRGLNPTSPQHPEEVALVINDVHAGLKAVLPDTGWQRCRVHFARDIITQALGSTNSKPVNAVISTISIQTSPEAVRDTYHQATTSMENSIAHDHSHAV